MTPGRSWNLAAILAGALAVAASFSLESATSAAGGGLYPGISRFELLLWLAHFALAMPGLALLAWGLAPLWPRVAGRVRPGRLGLGLLLLAALWVAEARYLRWFWLDDRPATIEESALRFGGIAWAEGSLAVPPFDPLFGFNMFGLERRDNLLWPTETPGALLVAAAAAKTGLGHLLFAMITAASGAFLAVACGRIDGRAGQVAAALLWTCSPMILLLGLSASGELLARSFLACAYAAWLVLQAGEGERRKWAAAGLGVAAALAFATRPVEAICLLLPVALHLAWTTAATRGAGGRGPIFLAGGLAALGPLGLYLYARISGAPFISFFGETGGDAALGARLAEATGSLALLLVVFFAGPLLLPLMALALRRGGAVVTAAAGGLLLLLLRPLFLFGGEGIHVLGPEPGAAALPLLLLSVCGLAELRRRLAAGGFHWRPWAAAGAGWLAGLLLLAVFQGRALAGRAELLELLEAPAGGLRGAIVLVEPAISMWTKHPEVAMARRWAGELPHPDPFLRDPVIYADQGGADPHRLRRAFPLRELYLLRASVGPELYRLEKLP